jgi:heterodisulfide reductase subunit C
LSENVSEIPKYVGNCFTCLKRCPKYRNLSEIVLFVRKFVRNTEIRPK